MKLLFVFALLVVVASTQFQGTTEAQDGFESRRINSTEQRPDASAGGKGVASTNETTGRDKRSPRIGIPGLRGYPLVPGSVLPVGGRDRRSPRFGPIGLRGYPLVPGTILPVGGRDRRSPRFGLIGLPPLPGLPGFPRAGREKRSPHHGGINNAQQNSNARAGPGGVANASGTAIAGK